MNAPNEEAAPDFEDEQSDAASDYSRISGWIDGTLVPVDKLHAHEAAIKHKAVSVFVVWDGQILLQRRALSKYHTPGLWANTCCTHPLWGETSLDCANRRLKEELGVSGLAPKYKHTLEYKADVGNGLTEHEVVDVFVAEWIEGTPIDPNPSEVSDASWSKIGALASDLEKEPGRFTPWLHIYMTDHRETIFADA